MACGFACHVNVFVGFVVDVVDHGYILCAVSLPRDLSILYTLECDCQGCIGVNSGDNSQGGVSMV